MRILCYPTSLNTGYIVEAFKILKEKNAKIKFGFLYSYGEQKSSLEIENEIIKAQKEIIEMKKNSITSIEIISKNIVSKIIENISGEKLNESSIKAVVEDISKKNIDRYL